MRLNNSGYILYDGIVSIILLSTTILFFNQIFVINSKINIKTQHEMQVINSIYWGIDNNFYQGKFNDVRLYGNNNQYCGVLDESQICIKK